MAENIMWDGKRPTRLLLSRRTLGWGTSFPTRIQIKDGEIFIRTDLKSIYKYNLSQGQWEDIILDEVEASARILALS